MRPLPRLLFALLLSLCLLAACGAPDPKPQNTMSQGFILGVADFTQPQHTWQLLAGYIPDDQRRASEKELDELSTTLMSLLSKQTNRAFKGPAVVRRCREIDIGTHQSNRQSALEYWVEIGKCVPVDYLLVPHLLDRQERIGGSMGVIQPASVILDLYVIDVKNGSLVSRWHYDEQQVSLTENLFAAGKFFSRGGRWLTAQELAADGMAVGIKELGL